MLKTVKQHRNVVSVNHNNLVKIRTVDPNRNTSKIYDLPSFMLCNARSANNKFDELSTVILEYDVGVSAITETWFKHDLPASLISIPGYVVFHKSRIHRKEGGVALYAKDTFKPSHPLDMYMCRMILKLCG